MSKLRVADDEALRKLALKVGGSVRSDGRVFNASGHKVDTPLRKQPTPSTYTPPAQERSQETVRMLASLQESFVALTQIVQAQQAELATLRELLTSRPKRGPVTFEIVRNNEDQIVRMIAKTAGEDFAVTSRSNH